MILSLRTRVVRAKVSWNARQRTAGRYDRRVCLGASFCVRRMVYDGCCWKHQDVYDKDAARRIRRARKRIVRRRHRASSRRRDYMRVAGMNPSGRY